jgi:hypothetical protein
MDENTNYIIIGRMKHILTTLVWLVSLNWCVLNFFNNYLTTLGAGLCRGRRVSATPREQGVLLQHSLQTLFSLSFLIISFLLK